MNLVKQLGFTLIELMLSTTFIAVLLIAVAMTTIQVSNIYNKGITLKEVNQAGRSISDELQRAVSFTAPFDVTPKQDDSPATLASKYVRWEGGGRLCVGEYSYAWNYGKALEGGAGAPEVFNKYSDGNPVRFVKVSDPENALCANLTQTIDGLRAAELLASGDRDLVLHKFSIQKTAENPTVGEALYSISFTVGTNDREQLASGDTSCKPPSEGEGSEAYCSVNTFDLVARAGNMTGE